MMEYLSVIPKSSLYFKI